MEHSTQSNTTTTLFNTDFCLELTNQILQNEAEKGTNFVASPLSLHVMLGLIAAGSKGQTLQQLLHFLGSTNVGDLNMLSSKTISLASPAEEGDDQNLAGGPVLSFINGAWLDQRFTNLKSSFHGIVNSSYKSQLTSVDFATKVLSFPLLIKISNFLFWGNFKKHLYYFHTCFNSALYFILMQINPNILIK